MQSAPSSPRKTAQLERLLAARAAQPTAAVPVLAGPSGHFTPPRSPVQLSSLPRCAFRQETLIERVRFEDDFYLNLLAWGADGRMACGEGGAVSLYDVLPDRDAATIARKVGRVQVGKPAVCAVAFFGDRLIASDERGDIGVFSGEQKYAQTSRLRGPTCKRIGVLDCNPAAALLSSGGNDGRLSHFDLRVSSGRPLLSVSCHRQELCGCRWSEDGRLVATGGNDNYLCVYDAAMLDGKPLMRIENAHAAAIKALAWSGGLLFSGGGTSDRRIHAWDVQTGAKRGGVLTNSQVCCLLSSRLSPDQIVSTHGFTENQVAIWDAKAMLRSTDPSHDIADPTMCFSGHTSRVLYAAQSPCGRFVATGAGDGTVRMWECFQEKNKSVIRRRLESRYLK